MVDMTMLVRHLGCHLLLVMVSTLEIPIYGSGVSLVGIVAQLYLVCWMMHLLLARMVHLELSLVLKLISGQVAKNRALRQLHLLSLEIITPMKF